MRRAKTSIARAATRVATSRRRGQDKASARHAQGPADTQPQHVCEFCEELRDESGFEVVLGDELACAECAPWLSKDEPDVEEYILGRYDG